MENANSGNGVGDDFFDDLKFSSSPSTTVSSSLGSSPPVSHCTPPRGGGRGGGGGGGGRGGNSNKKKGGGRGRPRNNNNSSKSNNNSNNNNGAVGNANHHHHPPKQQHHTSPRNSPHSGRKGQHHQQQQLHHRQQNANDHHHHYNPKRDGPPDITVVVNRVDLYDSAAHIHAVAVDNPPHHPAPPYPVTPYAFEAPDVSKTNNMINNKHYSKTLVAIQRVPYSVKYVPCEDLEPHQSLPPPPPAPPSEFEGFPSEETAIATMSSVPPVVQHPSADPAVVDNSTPNPFDPSIDKYWAQRRRLFTKFDQGIELDSEGWYSVTPEIIADHVAHRLGDLVALQAHQPLIILDAFCGCGGNGIAFGKLPPDQISMVVCVDTDRKKLRMAAHNASLYNVPANKIVFVECNSIFIMKHCYRHGEFILDQPDLLIEAGMAPIRLPSPVPTEVYEGYHIGGINMLPRRIDAVFMDPPWGGVDYEVLGKNGYDLEKNMKIRCQVCLEPDEQQKQDCVQDDFFDSFCPQPTTGGHKSKNAKKKANFNNNIVDDYVNGADMLSLAAAATSTRLVLYDLPRNTNKTSLGQSALAAGYRGNLKLEEHFLNGRLKTVTAYFGTDFSKLLEQGQHKPKQATLEPGTEKRAGLSPVPPS